MLWVWIGFILFVLVLLALDLGVFHRKAHVVGMREALVWSAVWVGLAILFSVFVYYGYEHRWMGMGARVDAVDGQINDGSRGITKYLTGYLIEKSLSVDNVFVIAMLFAFFAIPARDQHRLLFWGILGALLMRGVMIGAGAALVARFHWLLYLFGALLLFTAIKMLTIKEHHDDPDRNIVIRLTRKFFPKLPTYGVALVAIETTDLIFAVDSIPAIFAITADPFLVFTSNVFAILGLRSLYFALAGAMRSLKYLKASLAIILIVVGVKMLAQSWLKDVAGPSVNFYLLGLVMLILLVGVAASLHHRRKTSQMTMNTGSRIGAA